MPTRAIKRRTFLLFATIFLTGSHSVSWGQPASPAGRLAILREFAEAIGAAGDALKKLVDGIRHLAEAGVSGYDAVKARIVRDRIVDISGQATSVIAAQIVMLQTLEEYIIFAPRAAPHLRADGWGRLVNRINTILHRVRDLLNTVGEERSDFVLESAYAKLVSTLTARQNLLEKLKSIDPPVTPEELTLVAEAAKQYAILVHELSNARDEMNKYLKELKP